MSKQQSDGVEQKQLVPVEEKAHSSNLLARLPGDLLLAMIEFSFIDIKTLMLVSKGICEIILKHKCWVALKPAIIELKPFGISFFDPTQTSLAIPEQLSKRSIEPLIKLLSKLKNRFQTITTPSGVWYADLCQASADGRYFFKLNSTNISFSLPLLRHFMFRTLKLDIGDSKDQVSPEVLDFHFDELVAALSAVSSLSLLNDSELSELNKPEFMRLDEQKHSRYFNSLLAGLAKQGKVINRPFQIKISGILFIQQMSLLIQFLKKNPAIHALEIQGKIFKGKDEDAKELFVGLKETCLVTLTISANLSVDACSQLGENLPDSLENLHFLGPLENAHLQALLKKLVGKNIKSLSFLGSFILDFSPLISVLPKMPLLIDLGIAFSKQPNQKDHKNHEVEGISQILKWCSQPTSKITTLIVDCSSKLIPDVINVIEHNQSLTRLGIHMPKFHGYVPARVSEVRAELGLLIEAASNNLNLIELSGINYLNETCQCFEERNVYITEVKEMLADIKSSRSKWGLIPGKIDKLLTQEIPEKIQSALQISHLLATKYPQAHEKCQKICAELQAETDELRRHCAAAVIQSSFRLLCATSKVMDVMYPNSSRFLLAPRKRTNKIVPATKSSLLAATPG